MNHPHACGQAQHGVSRRQMLQSVLGASAAATVGGLPLSVLRAEEIRAADKQVVFVWLDGGMSQFESWDPKPGTMFGGPFKAIPTNVPGVRLCELMPRMAQRMDRVSLVRSLHTRFEDHSKAVIPIQQGDPKNRGVTYPFLGSAVARLADGGMRQLPPYIHIKPGSGGFSVQDAGFLGAKYGALTLGDGQAPANLVGPDAAATSRQEARRALRERANARFSQGRLTDLPEAYNVTYQIAEQMARHADLFNPELLPATDLARYGDSQFGRHLLQARRLIEAGVAFVKVTMYHWDTHGDNFNCHQDGVPQVDSALAALLDDLQDRGLYERTMVIVLSEFGRTPRINARVGRDHWPECWSMALGGGGIRPGAVVGATNDLGTFNSHEEYDMGHLFHTVFRGLGIDPDTTSYDNGGQPLPIAHDDCTAIQELLL
ncbi:MAG: DUF1501 domain-containing protein [Pirellulales bacterium]